MVAVMKGTGNRSRGQRVQASTAHALGRSLTSLRGFVARRYKRLELQLYAYESRHDPEVTEWIAETRRQGPPGHVPAVAETIEMVIGRERASSAAP